MKHLLMSLVCVALLSACGCPGGNPGREEGDTLTLSYASRLKVVRHAGYTHVTLADPWNSGKTLHSYVLVPSESDVPSNLPEGTLVRTPLRKAVVSTSVHCGLVIRLGKGESISGICEPQYIHIPWVLERLKSGKISDCGSGLSPTVETIIDLNPDAIFLSPFQNSGGYGQLEHLGVPIIETADYMESSPLGRAEWMKFYGLLFGAEQSADSLFHEVETEYLSLKKTAEADGSRLTVLMDKMVGGVWYVPGGHSTVGRLITDAATVYPWSSNDDSGSLSLPFESVLDKASSADIWLFRYNSPHDISYEELLSENPGYNQFKAFRERRAYGCNTATSSFYEETPFNPALLLRDIVAITHPGLKNLPQPVYFKPVR
ncbi:MAG: ABC transporter substrate-binding protein [Bacteroidaceae bacterium]|nr:ABC transporter substrate-binding protein [Bacteroidaceae bacterium]